MTCPCQSGRPYDQCCGPCHRGEPAPTPEALMRARYSAYALGDAAYVQSSWHPDTRPATLDLPSGALGAPMTYMLGRQQYIALTVGGVVPGLIALTLPMNES